MKGFLDVRKMVYASLCLALALVLPFLTGQIPEIGKMLCPMHLPILLCGFLCGWQWGLLTGAVAPILRSAIFGMPPMYPTAVGMMFELAAYGFFSGLLYRVCLRNLFAKDVYGMRILAVYASLILSMLLGRIVWGAAQAVLLSINGSVFTFSAFIAGAITEAIPGICLQLIVIPPVVAALVKAGYAPGRNVQ